MRALLSTLVFAATLAPTPPALRIGSEVRPTRYAAELTIDPGQEHFRGTIDIDIENRSSVGVVWLHANELTVQRAEALVGEGRVAARLLPQQKDFIGLAFASPLAKGAARLHLEYTGTLATKEVTGAARQRVGSDWYVFTEFEPIDARRVFPCFDEPSFKVPWRLSFVVPSGDRVFGNMPEVKRSPLGDGRARVELAESSPLPSYLIAFAIGPFETVDAGRSRHGVPIRIIVPKGQAAQARYAAATTREILATLEDYFGIPYPYPKLDHIAVPLFSGAMENPGLVTFGSSIMLSPPAAETIHFRRGYAEVASHELAHQWFGDLVTMGWWNDLWLNEAFATWMAPKVMERWQPTWGAAERRAQTRSEAMEADSLVSARQIRQPITSNDDIGNAFDGITYGKGASVLHMFEQSIGPVPFQKGVQRYLGQHAHGNASANDFLSAITAAAGRDIAPAFASFLDQPGVPLVSMQLACSPSPRLKLRQERYLPEGTPGNARRVTWKIPVCVRYAEGPSSARACTTLTEAEGVLPLPGACPSWILPNEGGAGYYRSSLSSELTARLFGEARGQLTAPERLALLGDLAALVDAGRLGYDKLLPLLPSLADDPNRHVVEALAAQIYRLVDADLVSDTERPAFARLVRDLWQLRARGLGWTAKAGEEEESRILRATLLPLVAEAGEDRQLAAEAEVLADRWFEDSTAVAPDLVDAVLRVAALSGDQPRFERWVKRARSETDQTTRRRLLRALSHFREPKLAAAALGLLLDDHLDIRESATLLRGDSPANRHLAWRFVQDHFDALAARLPRDAPAELPFVAAALCDQKSRAEVEALFGERAARYNGGPRLLAQALESLRICTAQKQIQRPAVARFLKTRSGR